MSELKDYNIITEAKDRFRVCEEWEGYFRTNYVLDTKFALGDSRNNWQWDDDIYNSRINDGKPCLTVNKVKNHNNQIINDGKQNKPGVTIRPVGENASFEAAQVFQNVIRHIEYISNAESVYDKAQETQVNGGIGYWRVQTDYIDSKSFDQEIFIRPVKDPLSIYLDPDINEDDGSDARYGFIFEDLDTNLFNDKYPEFKDQVGWSSTFSQNPDTWLTRSMVRVAEYYRKTEVRKRLVYFVDPASGDEVKAYYDELSDEGKEIYKVLKEQDKLLAPVNRQTQERDVLTDNIEWFKIAGDRVIERGEWLGKYIPIVRVVGVEFIINGKMDRKGHTRDMLDPQRMYNYNTSANTEFVGTQTKAPWLASSEAIEGYEEVWGTANTQNHSVLTYNAMDDAGNKLEAPTRPAPPMPSEGYVKGMIIAQNEMMMASGQYQAQMGENENAKSGVAINARQRQGDRATYHFVDNQAKAIRFTGKILIDLIPKIYDTKRVLRIQADDMTVMNVNIDPDAPQAYEKIEPEGGVPKKDKNQQMVDIIFNPNVGIYDVVSDVGPSYATRRQEAFAALVQIAKENKEFMGIAGDVLWKVADFPEAQVLAERWRKIIPKNITGDAPDPAAEAAMKEAADTIEQLKLLLTEKAQELSNKDRDNDIKEYKAQTEARLKEMEHKFTTEIESYRALTERLTALGNAGQGDNGGISNEQLDPVIAETIQEMEMQ